MAATFLAGCASTGKVVNIHRNPKESFDNALSLYYSKKYQEAEDAFKGIMENFPVSPYSVEAQLMLGEVCYTTGRYEDAGSYYTNFVVFHPTHPRASYALFQKGMSHFKEVLSIDRDQTPTRKALFAFEDLIREYPDSPYQEKAVELISFLKKRLAEREFYVARFYYRSKNYTGAIARFRGLLREYPESGLSEKTLYYIGESYLKLGKEELAREAFNTLINNFPRSPFVEDARTRLNGLG